MSECRCGKQTRDEAYTCEACGDDLARALGDVPWLAEELEVSATRQKGIDYRGVGGGKGAKKPAERPSPVSWGPSEARAHLRALLVSWALLCDQDDVRNSSPYDGLPDDDLPSLSRYLLWRVDGLMLLDIGSDAVDEIVSAVAHCHRVIDRPADKWFAGPCNECGDELYANAGARQVKCSTCASVYDMGERREWLRQAAREHNGTATEIARAVVVWGDGPASESRLVDRIRKWAARELIAERGHVDVRGKQRALYNIGDVLDRLEDDAKVANDKRAKSA